VETIVSQSRASSLNLGLAWVEPKTGLVPPPTLACFSMRSLLSLFFSLASISFLSIKLANDRITLALRIVRERDAETSLSSLSGFRR
jgi:hypothetical protein